MKQTTLTVIIDYKVTDSLNIHLRKLNLILLINSTSEAKEIT